MGTSLFDPAMMPGSPSSIRQMMSLLQAPQQEPAAQEGQQPQMAPPEYGEGIYPGGGLLQPTPGIAPQQKPSMVNRILDRFRPKAPAGYEGLLSPEEIKSARPGLLQSLIGTPDAPGASERYAGNLNNIVAMKQVAEQMRSQKTLAESRSQLAARFPEKENETPQETIARLRSMFAASVAAGDVEMAGKLGEVVKALGGESSQRRRTTEVNVGKEKLLIDADTGEVIQRYENHPSPRDPNAPDTAAQLRDQRMFSREQQLSDDFNKDTTPTREMAQKVMGAVAEAERAKAGDGVAQVNMLYAFISAMDPGTAVREGEIGLVRSAGSIVQQAQGILAKYTQGQAVTVPPAMVEQMERLMRRRLEGAQKYVKSRVSYYRNRANRWGVEMDAFPELELPDLTPAAPTKSGGAVKNSIGGIR